jgi:hypothetical protein
MVVKFVPHEKAVRDSLAGLLFRDIEIAQGEPVVHSATELATTAVYVDDRTATAAVIVADLPMSAFAGAAIGLIPKGGAEAAIEDRELSPSVKENFDEVLNVLASLFNAEGEPHVRLYQTFGLKELPPNDLIAISRTMGRRSDLKVTVAGYGSGRLSIILA